MDCPKKGCDGQIEAWFKKVCFCGVTDEGDPDREWTEPPSEEIFIRFECSQCGATWINRQQLLAEKGERVLEESKGGDIKKHMWD